MDFLLSKRMCVSHKVQLHAAADFICVQMFTESGRDVSVQPEEQGLWEDQALPDVSPLSVRTLFDTFDLAHRILFSDATYIDYGTPC